MVCICVCVCVILCLVNVCLKKTLAPVFPRLCKFKLCLKWKSVCVNCQNISRYIFETSVRHLKKVWAWKALGELSVVFLGGTYSKME